ncbi:MAG: HesA/MoeB/ThiF family protein [archaeon]|nr:HesA/MoeB/ThiF family protein [archaeon]
MSSRHDRQIPIIGEEGQGRLREAVVGIAGCGGLGTTVVTNLASAGVGRLVLVDGDVPDITNLNRQFVFREGQDVPKSRLLSDWASEVGPDVEVTHHAEWLTEDNLDGFFSGCDIVVDCLDSMSTRKMLSRYCVEHGKVFVHAGVTGYTGQLTVVVPGRTPDLEQIYASVNDSVGVTPSLGSMVGTLASLEATQVIQIITGTGSPFIGRMLVMNLESGDVDVITL